MDDYHDIISRLERLSASGSKVASKFLMDAYQKGDIVPYDEYKVYKYSCYSALLGDYDACRDMHLKGKRIQNVFLEDHMELIENLGSDIQPHDITFHISKYINEFAPERTIYAQRGSFLGRPPGLLGLSSTGRFLRGLPLGLLGCSGSTGFFLGLPRGLFG